jgi:hypothetical protein
VELLWEVTVALLLSVHRREPIFFSALSLPLYLVFSLPYVPPLLFFFSIESFSASFSFFSPPLLGPSSGFNSQRMRALWHAYGNGRVRQAPLKQLCYLCKNASTSLYFQPFLSF